MAFYQFAAPSLVSALEVGQMARAPKSKEPVKYEAILFAPEGAKDGTHADVRTYLSAKGLTCTPEVIEGKQALRVQGLQSEDQILSLLKDGSLTQGDAQQQGNYRTHIRALHKEDKESKRLSRAGAAYLTADGLFLMNGLWRALAEPAGTRNKKVAQAMQGAIWSVASLIEMKYGHRSAEAELDSIYVRMHDRLREKNIAVPDDSVMAAAKHKQKKGTWGKTEESFYRYPAEWLHGIYATGATFMMKAGFEQNNQGKKIAGGLIMGGGILGLLPLGAMGNKLASAMYTANNFFGLGGVLEEAGKWHAPVEKFIGKTNQAAPWSKRLMKTLSEAEKVGLKSKTKYCYAIDALGYALFLWANYNVFRAPKSQDLSKDKSMMDQLYNEAALIVVSQPERVQNFVATTVASELAKSRSISVDPRTMVKEIRAHAEALKHSPFLSHAQMAAVSTQTQGVPAR